MRKTAIVLSVLVILAFIPKANAYTNEEECGFCKQEPDCCTEIRNTGDAFACSWPIRGYCTPDTCSRIDGNHQKCGWYYAFHNANDNEYHLGTNSPNGYGCMIGDSEATMHPRCEPSPVPTAVIPTARPTARPTVRPTSPPMPTIPPPTAAPTFPPGVPTLPPAPTSAPLTIPTTVPIVFPINQPTALPTNSAPPPGGGFDLQIPLLPGTCSALGSNPDFLQRFFGTVAIQDRLLEYRINSLFTSFTANIRERLSR